MFFGQITADFEFWYGKLDNTFERKWPNLTTKLLAYAKTKSDGTLKKKLKKMDNSSYTAGEY